MDGEEFLRERGEKLLMLMLLITELVMMNYFHPCWWDLTESYGDESAVITEDLGLRL